MSYTCTPPNVGRRYRQGEPYAAVWDIDPLSSTFKPKHSPFIYRRNIPPPPSPLPQQVLDFQAHNINCAWDIHDEYGKGFLPSTSTAMYSGENTAGYLLENREPLYEYYPKGRGEFIDPATGQLRPEYQRDCYPKPKNRWQRTTERKGLTRTPFKDITKDMQPAVKRMESPWKGYSDGTWGVGPFTDCAWDIDTKTFEPRDAAPRYRQPRQEECRPRRGWAQRDFPELPDPEEVLLPNQMEAIDQFEAEPGRNAAWECYEEYPQGWIPSDKQATYAGDEREIYPLYRHYEQRERNVLGENRWQPYFDWDVYQENARCKMELYPDEFVF